MGLQYSVRSLFGLNKRCAEISFPARIDGDLNGAQILVIRLYRAKFRNPTHFGGPN